MIPEGNLVIRDMFRGSENLKNFMIPEGNLVIRDMFRGSENLKNFIVPEDSWVHGMPKKLGPGNFWKTGNAIVFRIAWRFRKCDKKFFFGLEKFHHSRGFAGAGDAQKIGSRELLKNWKCHCVQNSLEIQEMR
jgi:hypothetical protein